MDDSSKNITVIGIGAMGGGMARALLRSSVSRTVTGLDRDQDLVQSFFKESQDKAPSTVPTTLSQAVGDETQAVLVALVNEQQCESVCFEGPTNLLTLLQPGSCLIVTSTVTATWARNAASRFQAAGIHYLDCPMSGGPVRAQQGDLTLMASGDDASLQMAMPILNALGQVHVISGGVGMGSTVKMVHQLLAGVHICAAAEAMALAAKAGIDVAQLYRIVNGAAGASWMFQDRGPRMMTETPNVKSALDIFVKDLEIVHKEAKALQSPIPVASTVLQQFIAGQSLGLGKQDDSQVVQVYERITNTPVASQKKEGNEVGDLWKMEDGTMEEIVEVAEEPRHYLRLSNDYVRVLKVECPPNYTTLAHRHAEDSLYFFLVQGGLNVINHIQGLAPACDCMEFGEVRFGTHKTDQPLVHKITNRTPQLMICVDAEVLQRPPVTSPIPLVAEYHELIKTRDKCRVYKLTLAPGQSTIVSYPFFYLTVVLKGASVETEVGGSGGPSLRWTKELELGDIEWHVPVVGLKQTNVGDSVYEVYIAEWR